MFANSTISTRAWNISVFSDKFRVWEVIDRKDETKSILSIWKSAYKRLWSFDRDWKRGMFIFYSFCVPSLPFLVVGVMLCSVFCVLYPCGKKYGQLPAAVLISFFSNYSTLYTLWQLCQSKWCSKGGRIC